MRRSALSAILASAVPVAMVGALTLGGMTAAQATTYKIAGTFPLTGFAGFEGESMTKAVNLAVKEINASGALGKGSTIKAYFYDSQAAPDVGVRALQQAISTEDVPFILTGYSSVSLAQAPVAERDKRVLVNVGGASPVLSGLSPWFFNAIPLTSLEVPVLAHYLIKDKGLKKWALIYRDDALGRGLKEALPPAIKAFGGTLVATESYLPGSSDFRLQLVRIRAAHPQVVYIAGEGTEDGEVIAQATSLGLHPTWASYGDYNHESTIKLGGEAAEGGYYTNPSNYGPDLKPFPAYTKMVAAWKAAYGNMKSFDYLATQFYLGTKIYAKSIELLNAEGKSVTPENLRDIMKKTTFKNTVTGTLSFNKDNNGIAPIAIFELKDKKFVPVTVFMPDQVTTFDAEAAKQKQ